MGYLEEGKDLHSDDWRAELIVTPYAHFVGRLELWFREEQRVTAVVQLVETTGTLLYLLKVAMDNDANGGRDPAMRGFRNTEQLKRAKFDLDRGWIRPDSIRVYVGRLRADVRAAWAAAGLEGKPPRVVHTGPKLGYRLALPLTLHRDGPPSSGD